MTAPLAASASDRALAAFRGLVLSVYPAAVYWLTHEYAVAESDGLTFSGTPTDATISPQLPTRIPYAPSLAGSSCVVPAGTLAYVGFANADPSKPYLLRFTPNPKIAQIIPQSIAVDVTGSTTVVTLGDGGSVIDTLTGCVGRVVRYGDPIVFSAPGPGVVVPGAVLNNFSKVRA